MVLISFDWFMILQDILLAGLGPCSHPALLQAVCAKPEARFALHARHLARHLPKEPLTYSYWSLVEVRDCLPSGLGQFANQLANWLYLYRKVMHHKAMTSSGKPCYILPASLALKLDLVMAPWCAAEPAEQVDVGAGLMPLHPHPGLHAFVRQ